MDQWKPQWNRESLRPCEQKMKPVHYFIKHLFSLPSIPVLVLSAIHTASLLFLCLFSFKMQLYKQGYNNNLSEEEVNHTLFLHLHFNVVVIKSAIPHKLE